MVRNVIGSVLALAGAAAAVWSPFRAWYDGRPGGDYRIQDLFGGITDAQTEITTSILLPFAFAALVTLIGVVLRSRVLVALAGLVVLGFTILWMVRQGQAAGSLTVGGEGPVLGDGVAAALGGGLLLLLGALVMAGRSPRVEGFEEERDWDESGYPPAADQPYGWAPGPGDTQPLPTYPPQPTQPYPSQPTQPYPSQPYPSQPTQSGYPVDPAGPSTPRRPRPDPYGAGPGQDPFRGDDDPRR
ncbi:hypothetical protein OHA27_14605 [Streptomyces sp. NBC_01619]|uniref:hypothetical protein n=1 Tax=Streptomyces sp. NBC_01619 TaxID=2975901 RepID=UPI00225BE8D1|nr:hypothetical protein [Streptomyces sp. NBC_01619]MCX4511518.1 hypothetical protein [Streptomyces sp. NBC_01619]